jgi:hypothetical protein
MNRRRFFRTSSAAALTAFATPCIAGAADYAPITFFMSNDFDEERFGERTMIKQAMDIVHTRFRDMDVLRNVYRIAPTKGYNLEGGTWEDSGLADHPKEPSHADLLWYQITTLRSPNDEGDTEPEFPNVHIDAFHEETDVQARARTGLVRVRFVGDGKLRQSGEFRLEINRYKLGSGGQADTPVEWAAAIAHEMLHNLGHLHEKGDYSDHWQINIFHNSVYCNGHYPGGGDSAAHFH